MTHLTDNPACAASTSPGPAGPVDLIGLATRLAAVEAWRDQFVADLDAAQDLEEAVIADPPELDPGDEVLDPDRLVDDVLPHVLLGLSRTA